MIRIFSISQFFLMVLILLLPLIFPDNYLIQLFSIVLMYSIYSMSWNLLASSGQVSLGHAAFLGIGAYASVIISEYFSLPVFLSIFIGPLLSALIGLALGIVVLRLREWYLAMVTFGFSLVIQAIVVDDRLRFLTQGWNGIFPKPILGYGISNYYFLNYYIIAGITIAIYILMIFIFNSNLGRAFKAIRENENLAKASGINTTFYKLIAFTISTYIAGLSGAIYVHGISLFVSPDIFDLQNSLWPLIFTIAGGIGTAEGPIIGSFIIWIVWQELGTFAGYSSLLGIGIFLAIIVILAPKGIYPILTKAITSIQGKRS